MTQTWNLPLQPIGTLKKKKTRGKIAWSATMVKIAYFLVIYSWDAQVLEKVGTFFKKSLFSSLSS